MNYGGHSLASTRKTFTTGATLPAADLNTYLMEQAVVKVDTTTDLNATLASQGVRVAYCIANNRIYYYNGTSWVTDQAINAGFGYPGSSYAFTEHYGAAANTTLTVGNYYVPIQLSGSTQLSYIGMKATTFVTSHAISMTVYSSLNGKPNTRVGTVSATGTISNTTTLELLGGNYQTVRPGLYWIAIGIGATTTNTYPTVTQSTTAGGPPYMVGTSGMTDWTLMPYPGWKGSAGTYTSSWPTTCESVTLNTVAPVVRLLMNSTVTPSTPESGV